MWTDAYVYASHHLHDMQRICNRAVVLSAGRVIADAKVDELTRTMDLELPLLERRVHEPRVSDRAEGPARARQGRAVLGLRVPTRVRVGLVAAGAVLGSPASVH